MADEPTNRLFMCHDNKARSEPGHQLALCEFVFIATGVKSF